MVYILDHQGNPLMPTERHGKVRHLLKNNQAKVISHNPFTIQLLYQSTSYVQDVTLGIDSGYAEVGYSAITETKELIGGTFVLLKQQKDRLASRSMYRGNRRGKRRYRAPRFDNRTRDKGWLAPSIQHKLDSHLRFIEKLQKILPINKIVIEVATFDSQKIANPDISGSDYQNGEQAGFWNLREYILHRDNHQCQNPDCKNKNDHPILTVHHIVFRPTGTDKPSNLITLCNKCHTPKNHKKGQLLHNWMLDGKKTRSLRSAAFMTMVRWKLVDALQKTIPTEVTYGYQTKSKRIALKLEKSHHHDAFCIANGNEQIRICSKNWSQRRRNNRSLEKFYDAKYVDTRDQETRSGKELFSGRTTRNKQHNSENLHVYRGKKTRKGFRSIRKQRYPFQPGQNLLFENKRYTCGGTQNKGTSVVLTEIKRSINPKKLKLLNYNVGIACVI